MQYFGTGFDDEETGWPFLTHTNFVFLIAATAASLSGRKTRPNLRFFHQRANTHVLGDNEHIIRRAIDLIETAFQIDSSQNRFSPEWFTIRLRDIPETYFNDLHKQALAAELDLAENGEWLSLDRSIFYVDTTPPVGATFVQKDLLKHTWSAGYWADWYQGFLEGKPLDWELQRRVALIPDEDWEQGPEHIAELIEVIRAEFLAEKLPLAETVDINPDTGKFRVTPIPLQNQPLIGATLAQVSDALDDVLENSANGLNGRSRETKVIRRTIERYGNNPQQIEMSFTTVHTGLIRQIANDELPASEENTALIEALSEGAQSIRATHPEVAANREALKNQAFAELSEEQKQTLADAQPILEDISEGTLKEDFSEDIPFLLEKQFLAPTAPNLGIPERNPVLAGYAEAQRTLNRSAKMILVLKKSSESIKSVEKSSFYKAGNILLWLEKLVKLGLSLIP